MVDHSKMRLGKLPKKIDSRIPPLSKYLSSSLPPTPPVCDWTKGTEDFGMMANDRLGDCTCAAIGHFFQIVGLNASIEPTITDEEVIDLYEKACGYIPGNETSDAGGVEVDVLNYVLKNGFFGHRIDGYTTLDVGNRVNLKDAIWLLGGAYLGLELPLSCQTQEIWSVPSQGTTGDGAPGSWGGHAVVAVAFNTTGIAVVTWGQVKWLTWDFVSAYCSEAYGLLSKEWISSSGKAPSGFLYDDLMADMAALGKPTPLDNLKNAAADDPILFDLHWADLTINVHQALLTWILGLAAAAIATHGYLSDSSVQTWLGTAAGVFATWLHITKIAHSNVTTEQLVDAVAEIIDLLQRRKPH